MNEKSLEEPVRSDAEVEQSFAKDQLGGEKSKLLQLKWKKNGDRLAVTFFAKELELVTKRSVLSQLVSIFDPLGFATPIVMLRRFIFESVCDLQGLWDIRSFQNP